MEKRIPLNKKTLENPRDFGDSIKLIDEQIVKLPERLSTLLIERFGLNGANPKTLQAIGNKYSITRERVRQLEADGVKKIAKIIETEHAPSSKGQKLIKQICEYFEENGGIISNEQIYTYFKNDKKKAHYFMLAINLCGSLKFVRERGVFNKFWCFKKLDQKNLKNILNELVKILTENKATLTKEGLYEKLEETEFYKSNKEKISKELVISVVNISNTLGYGLHGIGLAKWRDITPKSLGDKAFIYLDYYEKPMHFSKIAQGLLNEEKIFANKIKKVNVHALHNELVKDSRFVLVGRGIYALSKFGFKKGTVSDVIVEFIKKAGKPVTKDEIMKEVLEKRLVNRSTVVITLNNKKLFKKTEDGMYLLVG